jgi:hypothetical protein
MFDKLYYNETAITDYNISDSEILPFINTFRCLQLIGEVDAFDERITVSDLALYTAQKNVLQLNDVKHLYLYTYNKKAIHILPTAPNLECLNIYTSVDMRNIEFTNLKSLNFTNSGASAEHDAKIINFDFSKQKIEKITYTQTRPNLYKKFKNLSYEDSIFTENLKQIFNNKYIKYLILCVNELCVTDDCLLNANILAANGCEVTIFCDDSKRNTEIIRKFKKQGLKINAQKLKM